MFYTKRKLECLRLRREVLALRCDTSRLLLTAYYQQFQKPEFWANQVGNAALRHPLWSAALSLGAGMMAVNVVRKPRTLVSMLGGVGGFVSTALSIWKVFNRKEDTGSS